MLEGPALRGRWTVGLLLAALACGGQSKSSASDGDGAGGGGAATSSGGSGNTTSAGGAGNVGGVGGTGNVGGVAGAGQAGMPGASGGAGGSAGSGQGGAATGGVGGMAGTSGAGGASSATYDACDAPTALVRMLVNKRDVTRNLCFSIQLAYQLPPNPQFGITVPTDWGVERATMTNDASACGIFASPPVMTTEAVGGTGTLSWVAGPGNPLPSTVDVDVVLDFGGGITEVLRSSGLPVGLCQP